MESNGGGDALPYVEIAEGIVSRTSAEQLLADLKLHNERMLEEHKRQLDEQYQKSINDLIKQFAPPPARQPIPILRPAITPAVADQNTEAFYEAARSKNKELKISIFEGQARKAVVRARMEEKGVESFVVRTTGSLPSTHQQQLEMAAEEAEKEEARRKKALEPKEHPSLKHSIYKEPLVPPASSLAKKLPLHNNKAAAAVAGGGGGEEERGGGSPIAQQRKTLASMLRGKPASEVLAEQAFDEQDDDQYFGKMDSNTQYFIKKTSFLLDQTHAELKHNVGAKKKKAKKKQQRQSHSVDDSNSSSSHNNNNNNDHNAGYRGRNAEEGGGGEVAEEEEEDEVVEDVGEEKESPLFDLDQEGKEANEDVEPLFPPVLQEVPAVAAREPKILKTVEFGGEEVMRLPAVAGATTRDEKQLPPGWSNQRVNGYEYEEDPHLNLTKGEWENEIARHVLSVYASANTPKDLRESKAVLEYVDLKKEETLQTVMEYIESEDGRGGRSSSPSNDNRTKSDQMGEGEEEVGEELEGKEVSSPGTSARPKSSRGDSPGRSRSPNSRSGTPNSKKKKATKKVKGKGEGFGLANTWLSTIAKGEKKKLLGAAETGEQEEEVDEEIPDEEARDVFALHGQETSVKPTSSHSRGASPSRSRGGRPKGSAASSKRGNTRGSMSTRGTEGSGWDQLNDGDDGGGREVGDSSSGGGGSSPTFSPGKKGAATEAGLRFDTEASFRATSKFRTCTLIKTLGGRGEEVAIRGSPRVSPIWFVSTGDVYLDWTRLPDGVKLQAHLTNLYEKRHFKEYLGIIVHTIDDMWRERKLGPQNLQDFGKRRQSTKKRVEIDPKLILDRTKLTSGKDSGNKSKETILPPWNPNEGPFGDEEPNGVWAQDAAAAKQVKESAEYISDEQLIHLWEQLIMAANAMGILCVEKKKYDLAMEILNKADAWANRDDILVKAKRLELKAHVNDALAFYFFKRGKNMSAFSYTNLALDTHEEFGNMEATAICLTHLSAIHCLAGRFKEAHKIIYQFLAMVEDGRLAFETATPKQLCLVAIAYHNLAVIQLKLLVPDLACKSSQNARKISRLCLSYSNRWIHVLQWTHEVALEDIKFQLTARPGMPLNEAQLAVIKDLTTEMYNPDSI